ncbi:glycosyltransferase, group 1 family protein [Anaerococcus hydrogenalis DSM 7454]|uniref:Glycosyltransferase, group 1 family protein n=1 Tax=Anaerococcus hydrogenalis DSM 7454 TaxID=561177 RepID=B6W6W1_9FIRM|nr:glycosyltransferase family 4 protein [Anaerococcus hydrogenalis]EEB36814.1 glycosyltransferase, group 1 family protein [Anaerococcus hydrogenalis DSM 7454]
MKILIYNEDYQTVKESGVGKAIDHQKKALELAGVPYTLNSKDDYDICHINTVFPKSASFAKKAERAGKKVVYHGHSTEEDFRNSFIFSNQLAPFFKKWLIYCYKKGDLILTPTAYSKKILESYKMDRKIEVVSNGIDLDFWKEAKNDRENFYQRYGLDENKKSIISVGLFIERKGILDFVDLAKRLPQYEFVWFGELNLKLVPEKVRRAVQSDLKNLHFPGYVNQNLLREAYSGSDLYIFPTFEETEGIVLLEALATKADIIIRDIEIYKNLKEGENIYKAKDFDEFYEKIKLIMEGDLPSLKEKAYLIAYEKSLENVGKKLKKFMKNF